MSIRLLFKKTFQRHCQKILPEGMSLQPQLLRRCTPLEKFSCKKKRVISVLRS